jgi:uncharacterized protein with PQ loop repeat
MNIVDLLGWLGGGMLAICSIPQTIKIIKAGSSKSMSLLFMWLWFWGEVFTLSYILIGSFSLPLFVNYSINLTLSIILLKYYYFPKACYVEAEQSSKES